MNPCAVSIADRQYQDRLADSERSYADQTKEREAFIDDRVSELTTDPFTLFVELCENKQAELFNELYRESVSNSGKSLGLAAITDAMHLRAREIATQEWGKL